MSIIKTYINYAQLVMCGPTLGLSGPVACLGQWPEADAGGSGWEQGRHGLVHP